MDVCGGGEAVQNEDGPGIDFNLSWFLHIPTHPPWLIEGRTEECSALGGARFEDRGGVLGVVPRSEARGSRLLAVEGASIAAILGLVRKV